MEHKDNYFSLFGLPESLGPDPIVLKQQFYALSKRWHPDRFVAASEEERREALRMSALINEGYKILSDSERNLAYLLQIKGLMEEDEAYKLPADFLMEMMELNEVVSDYENNPEMKHAAEQAFQEQWNAVQAQQDALSERLTVDGTLTADWAILKDLYFRKKYLLRIRERLLTFAAR